MTKEEWGKEARERGVCIVCNWSFGTLRHDPNGKEYVERNEEKEQIVRDFMNQSDENVLNAHFKAYGLVGMVYNHASNTHPDGEGILSSGVMTIERCEGYSPANKFYIVTTLSGSRYYIHAEDYDRLHFSL